MLNNTTFALKLATLDLTRDDIIEEMCDDGYSMGRVALSRVINSPIYPQDRMLNNRIECLLLNKLEEKKKELLFYLDYADPSNYDVIFTIDNTMIVVNKTTMVKVAEYRRVKNGYEPIDR